MSGENSLVDEFIESNKRVWLYPFGRKRNSISVEELAEMWQIIERFELSSIGLFDGSTVISFILGRTKFNGYNVHYQQNDLCLGWATHIKTSL